MFRLFVIFCLVTLSSFAHADQKQHPFVYFDSGKSTPIQTSIILDHNAKRSDYFWVRGFSDPTGSRELNLRLSQKRAEEVKNRLMQTYGIPESQIIVTFHGMDLRQNITNSQKRRVEIYSGTRFQMAGLAEKEMAPRKEKAKRVERAQRKISNIEEKKKQDSSIKDRTSSKKRYYVGAGIYHNVLTAKDQAGVEAEWISENNFNAEAQFQVLFGSLWIGARGSFHKQDYEQQNNLLYAWDKKSPDLYNFSLVVDREWERFGLGLDLNYNRVSFINVSGNVVRLKDVGMYGADLRAQYKWYDGKKWSSRLGVLLDYPLSGSGELDPKGELGYIGFIDLKKSNFTSNHSLNFKLYYGFKNYKSIQGKQEEEVVGLQILFMSPNWQ